jgi:hypothetical protein
MHQALLGSDKNGSDHVDLVFVCVFAQIVFFFWEENL